MDRKCLTLMAIVLSMAFALAEEEKYTTKYDDIDIDGILSNPKMRNQYVDCFMGNGPCLTPDAKYFKDMFPEAFVTKCRKCTDKQVQFLNKVTSWYNENDQETWNKVLDRILTIMKQKNGQEN